MLCDKQVTQNDIRLLLALALGERCFGVVARDNVHALALGPKYAWHHACILLVERQLGRVFDDRLRSTQRREKKNYVARKSGKVCWDAYIEYALAS
jgi:hypothetical protein